MQKSPDNVAVPVVVEQLTPMPEGDQLALALAVRAIGSRLMADADAAVARLALRQARRA
jgi:hypothetical protein